MKPKTGNIDYFWSKLTQSNMKGLLKIPCVHKCHTKYGSGSMSGHKRSRKVTKFKNSFLGMRHMFSRHFCTYNSKIEAILQSDPKKVNDREGSAQPSGHKRLNFQIGIFEPKRCVSEPVWSQDSKKVIFITVRYLKMLQITVWKKWRHQRIQFLGYTFAKNRHINLKFSMIYVPV